MFGVVERRIVIAGRMIERVLVVFGRDVRMIEQMI